MSLVPSNKEEGAIVRRTEAEPFDPKDARSGWRKFINFLRQAIGLKPVYLAERWAEAKILEKEAEAQEKMLRARGQFEKDMAEARRIDREGKGQHAKDQADAKLTRSVAKLVDSKSVDPKEAIEDLLATIQRIELYGGRVEIELPPPMEGPEDEADPEPS